MSVNNVNGKTDGAPCIRTIHRFEFFIRRRVHCRAVIHEHDDGGCYPISLRLMQVNVVFPHERMTFDEAKAKIEAEAKRHDTRRRAIWTALGR